MSEISRFFGLIIRMYAELGTSHHLPHFHVYFQDIAVTYGIDPIEPIIGELPRRQRRLLEGWAEMHQGELMENWARLYRGERPKKIEPLE